MLLITSGAYLGSEFHAEIGALPPCMLPLGNRRLFDHQIESINYSFPDEKVVISLPEGFELAKKDQEYFLKYNIDIVYAPLGFNLGNSLLYVLNLLNCHTENLRILHGDTYILDFPMGEDIIGTSNTRDFYRWERESQSSTGETIWCGYFSFSNSGKFISKLALCRGDFIKAVRSYDSDTSLQRRKLTGWHDFGHINTYFKARSSFLSTRSFNQLSVLNSVAIKKSSNYLKINAEALWFTNLPARLRRFIPQLISHHEGEASNTSPSYQLEYLPLLPLSEIFVHGLNPVYFWGNIFEHLNSWFENSSSVEDTLDPEEITRSKISLIKNKTQARLKVFSEQRGIPLTTTMTINGTLTPSLQEIANYCIEQSLANKTSPGVLHGDLCFSNILFDSRADGIKIIDPRGLDNDGNYSIFGDQIYDLAKLTHSIIGLYDFIIAGAFEFTTNHPGDYTFRILSDIRISEIQEVFLKKVSVSEVTPSDCLPETILLFLSMLPLHVDKPDRQLALMCNALRLYVMLMKEDKPSCSLSQC